MRFPGLILIALGLVLAVVLGWVLGPGAAWVLAHFDGVSGLTGKDLAAALDAVRGRALAVATGLVALAAVFYTARNADTARQGHITDRYTKAIEQLGSDKLDIRLGGIYALERIARDSARDHPTVMEVLAAFVREHSHDQDAADQEDDADNQIPGDPPPLRTDIQAALTVISRRNVRQDRQPIDLRGANLGGADLRKAQLADAMLNRVNLYCADLVEANLSQAMLIDANLRRTSFIGATLTHAFMRGADLTSASLQADLAGAILMDADLTGADIQFADLTDADLAHADLRRAVLSNANLTRTVLDGANLDGVDLSDVRLHDVRIDGDRLDVRPSRLNAFRAYLAGLTVRRTAAPRKARRTDDGVDVEEPGEA
ncbi:pentapeptide repeat-containing protein [Microbispora sp. NEAU-D428]|uniref:pentapeptide repeat-containing protein n=1 Tax=Microbispora sitophila TaxID=2771537 RepID=UPI00186932D0|nr:pentapeptide repeat-containing protein [Microbispora sitophila]MBE3013463.1 pentapeptide repeat-containing protein [Microbispora sitophila]